MEEYPMISWMPVDSAFWKSMTPPVPTERQRRDRAFVMEHDVARNTWFDSLRLHYDHLRPNYVIWDAERTIDTTYLFGSPRIRPGDVKKPPPMHLRTHLYLDLDTAGAALYHRSMAVFNGGASWHSSRPYLPKDALIMAIFCDLCEMERRAMEEQLSVPRMTLEKAHRIHASHTQRMKDAQRKFLETISMDPFFLLEWNMTIRKALGVDRMHQLMFTLPVSGPQAVPPLSIQGSGTR